MMHALLRHYFIEEVQIGIPIQDYISETAVEVIFGTPSKYCQGIGICRILSKAPKFIQLSCPYVPAHLSLSASGWLRLRFNRGTIPQSLAQQYFGQPFFQVDEPCPLPLRFRLPQYTAPSILLPGLYPILQTEESWIILFKTSTVNY